MGIWQSVRATYARVYSSSSCLEWVTSAVEDEGSVHFCLTLSQQMSPAGVQKEQGKSAWWPCSTVGQGKLRVRTTKGSGLRGDRMKREDKGEEWLVFKDRIENCTRQEGERKPFQSSQSHFWS